MYFSHNEGMKRAGFIFLFFAFASFFLFSQSAFDKEAAVFHKKAIKICSYVKSPSPNLQHADALVADANAALIALTQKYQTNPPSEYAGDPLWASYFNDWADNMLLVNTFVTRQDFPLVAKYCNTFCRIFVRMHENNGRVDLTDRLFMLNLALKAGTDMTNAGQIETVQRKVQDIQQNSHKIRDIIKNSDNKTLQQNFIPVDTATKNWLKAIHDKNQVWAKTVFGTFSSDFGKLFLSSL